MTSGQFFLFDRALSDDVCLYPVALVYLKSVGLKGKSVYIFLALSLALASQGLGAQAINPDTPPIW